MAYINFLLTKSGRYIIVVTTQSIINALKRSSQIKTKIMEHIDKSFDVIGSHENMLELFNENFESVGGAADIQLAFISNKHKVEFERYLKDLEKSVHSMEINNKFTDISNHGFNIPIQGGTASNIINQYTIKNVLVQRTFAPLSIMKTDSKYPNQTGAETITSKDYNEEIFKNEDHIDSNDNYSEVIHFESNELIPPLIIKQDVQAEIKSLKHSDNEFIEEPLSNRSNSISEVSSELQDSPIMSQLFNYDTKTLASVIVKNKEKKNNYFVQNSITDLCKDLELNLYDLRNRKVRNLLTTTNSKTLMKKLINNKKDGHVSHNILNSLITRTSEKNDTKCNGSSDAETYQEEFRNEDRNTSIQVDFENTGKLLHQNMEAFKIFERRLHDIRIKRRLDEIRNDRIREIHNIRNTDEFTESIEKRLTEKAMKEVIKDLSHNLDITMKKLAANERRFHTIEKRLKQLEQLSISSTKSNVRDLLNGISVNQNIELLKDDVKKIEKNIVADEVHCQFQSKRSEIPILKSTPKETIDKCKQVQSEKNHNQYTEDILNKLNTSARKINKNTPIHKKTYFHSIKNIEASVKSKSNDRTNYKKDILRMPIKNRCSPLSKEDVEKIIKVNNYKRRVKSPLSNTNPRHKSQHTTKETKFKDTDSKLNRVTKANLIENFSADSIDGTPGSKIEMNFNESSDLLSEPIDFRTSVGENSWGIKLEETEYSEGFNKHHDSVLDTEPLDITKYIDKDSRIKNQNRDEDPWDVDVDLIETDGEISDKLKENNIINNKGGLGKNKHLKASKPGKDKFDEIIAESVVELDAEEDTSMLSNEELNKIENSPDLQNVIQQLSNKLDNSFKFDSALNLEEGLTVTCAKNVADKQKNSSEDDATKDTSSDYINAINKAFQNCAKKNSVGEKLLEIDDKSKMKLAGNNKFKSNAPVFSTIDLNKYNTEDSDKPFEYKDAIMNEMPIKKSADINSEKIMNKGNGDYKTKKANDYLKNKEVNKTEKSDKGFDYEMQKINDDTLNTDKHYSIRDQSNDYELEKVKEHLINVEKSKTSKFFPIMEVLESELLRCCKGKRAERSDIYYDFEKACENLKNKSLKQDTLLIEFHNANDSNSEKFHTYQYGVMKAFEHFRTKDNLEKLRLLNEAADCEKNKNLKLSPTLTWDSKTIMDSQKIEAANFNVPPYIEMETIKEKIEHKCEEKKADKFERLTDSNKQTNYDCITTENENALEGILHNINNAINNKNIAENIIESTENTETFTEDNEATNSSNTSMANDGNNDGGPEEKYKKMCNLLKSIKETIQAHKARVEQTIKNYEDIFQQNTFDVMIQKHGGSNDTIFCHDLVDHLNHRRSNFNTNVIGLEDFKNKLSNMYDPNSAKLLVNRESFKTMVSDFMKEQKKNDEFFQRFDNTVKSIQQKPKCYESVRNKLGSTQYKKFCNEYSKQFSELHKEIVTITDSNDVVSKVNENDLVAAQETGRGRFENQISKLSIETEKNQSKAHKNVHLKATKISMPMLQKENIEIDKMIEANKKAFAELESTLKVVKLIGHNTSATSSLHNISEELGEIHKTTPEDTDTIVIHYHDINESNRCETSSLDRSESDSSIRANDSHYTKTSSSDSVFGNKNAKKRNVILEEVILGKIKSHMEQQNDVYNLTKQNNNSNLLKEVKNNTNEQTLTKKDESIKTNRKGSDNEFHRDKHTTQTSLKQHEVKKKEYHTRCTNVSKDPNNENENKNNDIPTALIVSNNIEIPIQIMPIIDDSIFLNNFNIDKSLINFEVPRKELISVAGEDGCKENYLKESITENVLFKKLINLEEVKKFFRYNERKTPVKTEDKIAKKENENKQSKDVEISVPKSDIYEPEKESMRTHTVLEKDNDLLLRRHSMAKHNINAEENIKRIKEQSLKKKHLERKPIDNRTRDEIEQTLSMYKKTSLKKRQIKGPKYNDDFKVKNPQKIVNQLKDFISKTDFQTNDQQNISKQQLIATNSKSSNLKMEDPKRESNITYDEALKAMSQIEDMLESTTENSNQTEIDDNNTLLRAQNKLKVKEQIEKPQVYIQDVSPYNKQKSRQVYEIKDISEPTSLLNASVRTEKKKPSVTIGVNLNQGKNKLDQSQEEYIYIEPSKDERNRKTVGMIQIEDIVERKKNIAENAEKYKHVVPSKLEYAKRKPEAEQITTKSHLEQFNPKLTESIGGLAQLKKEDITSCAAVDDKGNIKKNIGVQKKFKLETPYVPPKNNKLEKFLHISEDGEHKFPYVEEQHIRSKKRQSVKISKAKHELFFGNKKMPNSKDLIEIKHENTRKVKDHLKILAELNMNSAKTKQKFANIYEQIAEFNPKHDKNPPINPQLQAWIPKQYYKELNIGEEEKESENSEDVSNIYSSENVINVFPKNMDLFNQISILPQKTMWNPHHAGRNKMWKRLQHVKKLANEKNPDKLYVLGTKLPTLRMTTSQAPRKVSERLLPIKKPKQYKYQVKKVKVGERIMNITYLVEVKNSKL